MKLSVISLAIFLALVFGSVDGAPHSKLQKRHKGHHGHTGHHTTLTTTANTKVSSTKTKISSTVPTATTTATTTAPTGSDPQPTGKVCNVAYSGGGDDSGNINAAFKACQKGGSVVFKKGTTYQLNKALAVSGLNNVKVYIQGNILYPYPMQSAEKYFMLSGTNVKIFGSVDPNWGIIMGQGQKYWDAGKLGNPKMLGLKIVGGGVYGLKMKDAPSQFISITSTNFEVMNVGISAVSSDPTKHPAKNTDAFDVSHSTNITISGAHVVNNDDCLAINGNVHLLHFTDSYCEGSHGASVGSLGKKPGKVDDVSDIYISNIYLKGSTYAARFKSWPGGQGTATNLNWNNIVCDGCDMPIFLTEEYCDHEVGCKSGSTSIKIDGVSFTNFTGITSGINGDQVVNITCSPGTPCTNIKLNNINVKIPGNKKPLFSCSNVPRGLVACGN